MTTLFRFRTYALFAASLLACVPRPDSDGAALLALHEQLLRAHRERDVDRWMRIEAETLTVASRGRVTQMPRAQRLTSRERYFATTRFSVYRDLAAPEVRVAADGSLGWVIANVEVVAHPVAGAGADSSHTVWAWIELYERRDGQWRLVGNVSNERVGGSP